MATGFPELSENSDTAVQLRFKPPTLLSQLGKRALTSRLQDGYVTAIAPFGEYLHIILVRYAAAALATNPEKS